VQIPWQFFGSGLAAEKSPNHQKSCTYTRNFDDLSMISWYFNNYLHHFHFIFTFQYHLLFHQHLFINHLPSFHFNYLYYLIIFISYQYIEIHLIILKSISISISIHCYHNFHFQSLKIHHQFIRKLKSKVKKSKSRFQN
jgi:hypothetical protein